MGLKFILVIPGLRSATYMFRPGISQCWTSRDPPPLAKQFNHCLSLPLKAELASFCQHWFKPVETDPAETGFCQCNVLTSSCALAKLVFCYRMHYASWKYCCWRIL